MLESGDAPFGRGRVEPQARPVGQPDEVARRVFESFLVLLAAVGRAEIIGVFAVGQFEHAHVDALAQQHLDGALGCVPAGLVGIEIDRHGIDVPAQRAHLLRGQGRAAGCHGVGDARLADADHVHVAFDEHDSILLAHGGAGPAEVVEHGVLLVDRGFGRVQILRLALGLHRPAAESDDAAGFVVNGESQAFAEAVVEIGPVFGLADQSRGFQGFLSEPLFPQQSEQRVAARRVADAELRRRFFRESARAQIFSGPRADVRRQPLLKERLRGFVHAQQRIAEHGVGVGARVAPGHGDALPVGQGLQRFVERQPLQFHQEVEYVAALPAAETLVNLQASVNGERGRLLRVERAQTDEPLRALLLQAHELADRIYDVNRTLDLPGEVHPTSLVYFPPEPDSERLPGPGAGRLNPEF